jgi:hypothetical protein
MGINPENDLACLHIIKAGQISRTGAAFGQELLEFGMRRVIGDARPGL